MVRNKRLILLALSALGIKVFSLFPDAVEKVYSTGIYPWLAWFQRLLFGWIPFSVGDLFYAFVFFWLLRQVILLVRQIRRRAGKHYFLLAGRRLLNFTLVVYVLFNVLWGLNYNRRGVAYQLQLDTGNYTKDDLLELVNELALKLNSLHLPSLQDREKLTVNALLFDEAVKAYSSLGSGNAPFGYAVPSVKPSLYSYLGNWLGFTGYYNPFSGEAQVNTTVPVFILPFLACHEIGHQLGYGKESEANFAGYLAASASADPRFQYAVYFDLYSYAGRYLFLADSVAFKKANTRLLPGVKKDFSDLRHFYRKYDNPVGDWIDTLYSQYLKANEQPSGKLSYSEVVGVLIAYKKKYGAI